MNTAAPAFEGLQQQILGSFDEISQELSGSPCMLPNGYPVAQSLDTVMQGIDVKAMSVDFTIVTRGATLNRHGNKVQIAQGEHGRGILLDNYQRNPVVLFDHGYGAIGGLPIARSEDDSGKNTVKLMATRADATAYFSQSLPEAVQIFALINEKMLRTASISFLPLKAMRLNTKPGKSKYGPNDQEIYDLSEPYFSLDFLESDLLEWSVVGVPADPGAVRKMLEAGKIGTERITMGIRRAMTQMAGEKPIAVPGWGDRAIHKISLKNGETELQVESQSADIGSVFEHASQLFEKLAAKKQVDVSQASTTTPAQHQQSQATPATVQGVAGTDTGGAGTPGLPSLVEMQQMFAATAASLVAPLRREIQEMTGRILDE